MVVSLCRSFSSPALWACIALILSLAVGPALWGVEIPFADAQAVGAALGHGSMADLDGDGDLDLLGEVGSELVWLENDGAWTQRTVGPSTAAGSVEAADLDGDGDLDVLVASTSPSEISWWESTAGNGTAWTKHVVGTGTRAQAGDFDRDGDADIAVVDGGVTWLENIAGDGSAWSSHVVDALAAPTELLAEDLDGDGDTDLVGWGDDIGWWQNTADSGTWTRRDVATGIDLAESLGLADMDGDGDLDVLAATFVSPGFGTPERVGWWENTAGDGTVWAEHLLQGTGSSLGVSPADLDGDGDVDVIRAFQLGAVDWWENLGSAGDWQSHAIDGGTSALGDPLIGDVDQDGDLDMWILDSVDGALFFENRTLHRKASFPMEIPIDDAFTNALSVAVADFDGDGDQDVAAGASGGLLSWWENAAGDASVWSEHTVATDLFEARRLISADLDGDGDPDLVSGSASEGGLGWWQNQGDGSGWADRTISDTFSDFAAVRAADLDGDGDLDVIASSFSSGVSWWENSTPLLDGSQINSEHLLKADGDGTTWIEHSVVGGTLAQSVDVADFDGDGDLDLVAPDYDLDAIHWWENAAGDGSAWTRHDVVTGVDSPTEVRAADFNGDGHPDVVGVLDGVTDIWRWQNDGSGGGWSARIVSLSLARDLDVADIDEDGDLDVLGPQSIFERLAWWRNADDGFNWFTHTATTGFEGGMSATVADLDGDGHPDLVGAAQTDGLVAWWPNLGGQAELITANAVLGGTVRPNQENKSLLTITARHHGRLGDDDLELSDLALLFEAASGVPLSDSDLNTLVESIHVYRDDGDGSLDVGMDQLLHSQSGPFTLSSGVLSLAIADDTAEAAVSFEADDVAFGEGRFFVTADIASFSDVPDSPILTFRVGHLVTEEHSQRSGVEMRSTDLPLSLADPQDGFSSLLTVELEPDVAISATELSFGRHPITAGPSAAIDFLITNEGFASLALFSVEIDGPDGSDFVVASDTGELSLAPGGSRTLSIAFDPSTTGTRFGELLVLSNDPDAGFLVVDLIGIGTDPEIDVSSSALDFGDVEVGEPSAYQTVTIANEGTTSMEILGLELVGEGSGSFEILDASPGLIASGGARVIEVRFVPEAIGSQDAELRITSDDPDESTVDMQLSGVGTLILFVDGFESGDTSRWSESQGRSQSESR